MTLAPDTITALKEMYADPERDVLKFGAMVKSAWKESGSLSAISRETGISVNALSHHHKLLTLPDFVQKEIQSGRLTFKEARALCGLSRDRLRDHITPFVKDVLSSVHVEDYVRLAKKHPAWPIKRLTRICLGLESLAEPATATPEPEQPDTTPEPATVALSRHEELLTRILSLAGEVSMLEYAEIPEHMRLRVIRGLETLAERSKMAAEVLRDGA